MTLLTALALRPSVLLAAGLFVSACLARRSAALRHAVLSASLVAATVVIPLSLVIPEWTVALPPARSNPSGPVQHAVTTAAAAEAPAVDTDTSATTSGVPVFLLIWLAGTAVAGSSLVTGLIQVRRLARRAVRVEDAEWIGVRDRVAARYGMMREIVLSRTDADDLLATVGLRHPQVLFPRHSGGWTLDRVHVVVSHELAHIRRRDWLVQVGAEAVRAILWFNPLAWIVCTRVRREAEHACDDEVLRDGVSPSLYAEHLLALARQCRRPTATWPSAVPMAHPSTLERRIAAMLNPRLDRRSPSWRAISIVGVALALVALPVAALRARQAGPAPLAGTIYDVSGAVLPGVEVVLVDANQISSVAYSNASGRFEFPAVAPGKYDLKARLMGFRPMGNELELGNPRDWNRTLTMQVGDLRETVTVRETRVPAAPSPSAAPRRVVRVGGNIRAPRKELDVRPEYPPAMRAAGLTGVVPIEAVISRDGSVASVRVLSAEVHPDFAIAAVDAVRQWRYTPTLLNGVPVDVVMTVSVQFDLD